MADTQAPMFDDRFTDRHSAGDATVSYSREDRSWADAAPSPVNAIVSDLSATWLQDSVSQALQLDTMLDARRIGVLVEDGVVILTGEAKDASDRALAGLIARRQPGVQRLENRLVVEPDRAADFSPENSDHALTSNERFAALRS